MNNYAIILAANDESQMHSSIPRALHKLAGREMIHYVMDALEGVELAEMIFVINEGQSDAFRAVLGDQIQFIEIDSCMGIEPEEQLGKALPFLPAGDGYTFVLADNLPLLDPGCLGKLCQGMRESDAKAGALTWLEIDIFGEEPEDVGDDSDSLCKIDATNCGYMDEALAEVGLLAYCFQTDAMVRLISDLAAQNKAAMLDDVVIALADEEGAATMSVLSDADYVVDDMALLAEAEKELRERINRLHMLSGVRLIDPQTTYIDYHVSIDPGAVVYPGNVIEGKSQIRAGAVLLHGNYIEDAVVGTGTRVGPNSHLRPSTILGEKCRVGNYVELKNITVGAGSKIPHLSYCGDGSIGAATNVGCGVIFSNYDGINKAHTNVGSHVFVGCNANLVAPVTVGDGAYIAAGSTIIEDVPDGALGLARSRQVTKEGWAETQSPIAKANTSKKEKQ